MEALAGRSGQVDAWDALGLAVSLGIGVRGGAGVDAGHGSCQINCPYNFNGVRRRHFPLNSMPRAHGGPLLADGGVGRGWCSRPSCQNPAS